MPPEAVARQPHGSGRLRPSAWPTADQELLAKAALLDQRRALQAWEAWKTRNGGSQAWAAGELRGLRWIGALIHRNLAAQTAIDPLLTVAGRVRAWHARAGSRLHASLAFVVKALRDGGVPCMLLKGCALSRTVYRDESLRPMSD